jgi:ribosomal protein L29
MLKTADILKLNTKEIDEKVAGLKTELFNKKFNRFTSGGEKLHLLKEHKKDIARLLTVKNMKKTGEK